MYHFAGYTTTPLGEISRSLASTRRTKAHLPAWPEPHWPTVDTPARSMQRELDCRAGQSEIYTSHNTQTMRNGGSPDKQALFVLNLSAMDFATEIAVVFIYYSVSRIGPHGYAPALIGLDFGGQEVYCQPTHSGGGNACLVLTVSPLHSGFVLVSVHTECAGAGSERANQRVSVAVPELAFFVKCPRAGIVTYSHSIARTYKSRVLPPDPECLLFE